jgi:hypothetical protein
MVLALDLLSRIASRYGRCGRKVFEANQDPIVSAMQLFECLPFADAHKMLVEPLSAWLKSRLNLIQKVGRFRFLESFKVVKHQRQNASRLNTAQSPLWYMRLGWKLTLATRRATFQT